MWISYVCFRFSYLIAGVIFLKSLIFIVSDWETDQASYESGDAKVNRIHGSQSLHKSHVCVFQTENKRHENPTDNAVC